MTGPEITTICTTALSIATLICGYLSLRAKNNVVETKVDDVHTLVNSNLTAIQDRAVQLTATLTEHNIPVPPPPGKEGTQV
jgi:hypothetical protein